MKIETRSSISFRACLLALVMSVASTTQAQQTFSVCSSCFLRIVESRTVRILDSTGVLPSSIMEVVPLGRAGFSVLGTDLSAVRLDRTGNVSLLLPKGAGPYEQGAIYHEMALGDTTILFDVALRRITRLYRGRPLRMSGWQVPPFVSIAKLPAGWVVNGAMRTIQSIGYPFHILNDSGVVLKSFGKRLEVRSPEGDPAAFRHRVLYDNARERILIVKERSFQVSGYGPDGTQRFQLEGNPEFWREASDADDVDGVKMPRTYVRDARIDDQGRLWLAIIMASDNWKQAIGPVRQRDGRVVKRVTSIGLGYKSVIVAVDLENARVIGMLEQPGQFQGFGTGNSAIFWQGTDDATGVPILREVTWRF